MPRVDATIDDDLFSLLEAEARGKECSKASLLRDIIQEHYDAPATPQATAAGSGDLKVLTAMVDALARYLCVTRPLDDRLLPDEEAAAKRSWERWKEWSRELSTR